MAIFQIARSRVPEVLPKKKKYAGPIDYGYVVGKTGLQINVYGDSKGYIDKALNMLAEKAPEDLEFIAYYLKYIEVSAKNADVYNPYRKTFELGQKYYDRCGDIYWLCGAIAHEANHAYNKAENLHQGDDGEDATNNELTSFEYQIGILKKIGAPKSLIRDIGKQDGRHWDENGDGVFDESDVELRRRRKGN